MKKFSDEIPYRGLCYHSYFCYGVSSAGTGIVVNQQKLYTTQQKVVNVLNSKSNIDSNGVYHLEDTMIMYGKYNSDTLMELVNMVHQMQNATTWKEKVFVSKMNEWLKCKLEDIHSEFDYSIDPVLFLTMVKEKYV